MPAIENKCQAKAELSSRMLRYWEEGNVHELERDFPRNLEGGGLESTTFASRGRSDYLDPHFGITYHTSEAIRLHKVRFAGR